MSHYPWKYWNWEKLVIPKTKHAPLCYYCHKKIKEEFCFQDQDGYSAHKQCFEEEA